jgi:hypothetical protein
MYTGNLAIKDRSFKLINHNLHSRTREENYTFYMAGVSGIEI